MAYKEIGWVGEEWLRFQQPQFLMALYRFEIAVFV